MNRRHTAIPVACFVLFPGSYGIDPCHMIRHRKLQLGCRAAIQP